MFTFLVMMVGLEYLEKKKWTFSSGLLVFSVPFRGGSVMVWVGITINNFTYFVVIRDGLMAQWYIEEVLNDQIRNRAESEADNIILVHNGVGLHIVQGLCDSIYKIKVS